MRIVVKVIPRSSRERVVQKDGETRVYVKSAPVDGKANKALIEVLSREYGVKKSSVRILSGSTSRRKLIEIGRGG